MATTETTYLPRPLEFTRLDADEALRRSEEFLELMRTRRSVRHFSSEPVPHQLIENALRTAGTAPSGANQQPCTARKVLRLGRPFRQGTSPAVGSAFTRGRLPCQSRRAGRRHG